jgi:hypothetical protein
MLTGKRFWTLAVVLSACVLAAAGCRRKSSDGDTIVSNGIFTTDNFPGASVQDGNVSDDKRAFSISGDSFSGGLVCTHNGDRGTIMVTYRVDEQIFAHYFDGSTWTIGVALRHFDTYVGTTDANEIVHAFVNTSNDGRSDAEDRDGDCLIFWNALDFDTDGGSGGDEENQCEYVTYFDVTHVAEADLNHGFDIDPLEPGFFEAQRVSSLEFAGEDVLFQGIATEGLCGEARWIDGGHEYSYGDDTISIYVFYHQNEEKSVGVFDETTQASEFDLDLVVDEEFPLLHETDVELALVTNGASDSGVDSQESCVGEEYFSYNNILGYRVRTLDGSGSTTVPAFRLNVYAGLDVDVSVQYTHCDPTVYVTRSMNANDGFDSDAVSVDDLNSDFTRTDDSFLSGTGRGVWGRDEGLSALVVFFSEIYDPDNTIAPAWAGDGVEGGVVIAEIDEDLGTLLNDAEASFLPFDEIGVVNTTDPILNHGQISRNGDYIWFSYFRINGLGTFDEYNLELVYYQTTRLDSDGLPVGLPLLSASMGAPFVFDPEDGHPYNGWGMFQSNLGYRCGIQSDAQEMCYFWTLGDAATGDSLVYYSRLTADVDGVVGAETASAATLLIDEDVSGYHSFSFTVDAHLTFNATDAGQDGDFLYTFTYDDNDVNGLSDTYVAVGRIGVTSAAPIELGSGVFERHAAYADFSRPLEMVATPPGTDIGAWDVSNSQYDGAAHHGAEFVHCFFGEAETSSYPFSGPNTTTGWALRTRVYDTDLSGGTFGDDFTPNAGTAFIKPFDIDLPFTDPDTSDDADVESVLICENRVGIVFTENEHLYWQECTPGGDSVGWRVEEGSDELTDSISDPALIDDDNSIQLESVIDVCSPSCTCCDLPGTAIFWTKVLDDNNNDSRLQVRIVDSEK